MMVHFILQHLLLVVVQAQQQQAWLEQRRQENATHQGVRLNPETQEFETIPVGTPQASAQPPTQTLPQQPSATHQPPASQQPIAPTQRSTFNRAAPGVPLGLQMAQFAPQAVSGMLQNMGPAAIGGYGLLFNPGAVMTLTAGPGGAGSRPWKTPNMQAPKPFGAKPTIPSMPKMSPIPKPQKPAQPLGTQPKLQTTKPPTTMVPI